MKLNRYFLWCSLSLVAALSLCVGCDDDDVVVPDVDPTEETPSVTLADANKTTETTLQFTITPEHAEKCYYFVHEADFAEYPTTAEQIIEQGVQLTEAKAQTVEVTDLLPGTSYKITAAVVNKTKTAMANAPLVVTTTEKDNPAGDMKVTITDVQTTTNSITYVVTCANAGAAGWDCYEITPDFNEESITPYDIIGKGHAIDNLLEPYTVEVTDLKDDTEYCIFAAVESPVGYIRVMTKAHAKTQKLDAPVENPEELFANAELKVFRGKNYVISAENEKYTLSLDLFSESNQAYLPFIPAHEYTFNKNAYMPDWNITSMTCIEKKETGERIEIEKGSLEVTMPSPSSYVISGKIISTTNEAFNFKITSDMVYPVDTGSSFSSIVVKTVEGQLQMVADFESSMLTMPLPSEFAGSKTYEFTQPVVYSAKEMSKTYKLNPAKLVTVTEDDVYYDLSFEGTTEEGLKMSFAVTSKKVEKEEAPTPGEDEKIAFTSASGLAYDEEDWSVTYEMDLESNDWEFVFAIGADCTPGDVPVGTYIYSTLNEGASMGCIGNYRIVNRKDNSTISDLDEGKVIISKNDDGSYSIDINIKRLNGQSFLGAYKGDIPCMVYGGGGGGLE